jgi:Flp pilus assembly pilin Flp
LGWRGRDDGASSVEYALIALFIAVMVAASIGILGALVGGLYQQGDDAVTSGDIP